MFTAVVVLTLSFLGLLVLKSIVDSKLCTLCGAVSGTWLVLLGISYLGQYGNETAVALLLGQSIVGVLYVLRNRLPPEYDVYSFPFVIAGTVLGYVAITGELLIEAGVLTAAVWLVAGLLFTYRENDRVATVFDEVVACCRDW